MYPRQEDEHPTATAAPIILRLLNGPEAGRVLPLLPLPCIVGRGGRSHVVLADTADLPTISREHLTLAWRATGLVVTDHSINGTQVEGGSRLERGESALVNPGAVLLLGASLRLSIEHAQVTTGPAAVGIPARGAGGLRAFLTDGKTLQEAWRRVALNRGAAGPDNVTVADFARDADRRLAALREELRRNRYAPLPPRLFAVPKRAGAGVRAIAIFCIRDRIVQQALHQALSPLVEPHLPPCSFAYRPGLSAHDALKTVDSYLRLGLTWAAETDIADFFDSVTQRLLLKMLGALVPDAFALTLVARCLGVGAASPGRGIPQGAATSPLLGNLYLAAFDEHMLAGGWNPVRYGDDMLFLCTSRARAQAALAEAEGFLRSRLDLSLRAGKTAATPLAQGFTFLGYRFTEAGRGPAPEAVASHAGRLQETTDPAKEMALRRGWANYFGEMPRERRGEALRETLPEEGDPCPAFALTAPLDAEGMARFLALFGGREDAHASQPFHTKADQEQTKRRRPRFVPCTGPLAARDVARHLAGEEAVAAYLLRRDGTVGMVVLDIDAAEESTESQEAACRFAQALWRFCRRVGVPAALEDSGRRGRHLWVFFSAPVSAEAARRLARLLAARAGFPCLGVRVEVLPRHTEWPGPELGDAIKLPFGVHPVTGHRCHLLDEDDQPLTDPKAALAGLRTLDVAGLDDLLRTLTRMVDMAGAQQRRPGSQLPMAGGCAVLIQGCSVVRALIERAERNGHLRHTHRLILLYTLGHLGENGAQAVHRVMALCRNYDADICQGYLDRLDRERKPLSCARIREWLEEEGETGLCTCPRERHTPLSLVPGNEAGANEAAAAVAVRKQRLAFPTAEDGRLWDAVAGDLFAAAPGEVVNGLQADTV